MVVHLLIPPGGDLRQVSVACRATMPELGSWNVSIVTCPQCLRPLRPPRPRGEMLERELQELIRQACRLNGWLYYHTHRAKHSPAGFPDVVAIRHDRLLVGELKRQGRKPTLAQAQWLEAFNQVKVIETYVWQPADVERILEVLK